MKKPRFKYPSVTEILEPYVDYSMVRPEILKAAQVRGTIVHGLCGGYAKYGFVVGKVPARYQGYLDSFRRWFDLFVEEVLAVEERIYNDALRVCGQLDLLVQPRQYSGNLPIVVDIKTPVVSYPTWSAQVSAYKFLVEHERKILTGIPCSLRVKQNGSDPALKPVENYREAIKHWIMALQNYHYFSR